MTRRRDRERPGDAERGSVLLLGIGLIAVCLMAVVVTVDASAAFVQRRELMAVADAAALAGAQAIDFEEYYRTGATIGTRLDPPQVALVARRQVAMADDPTIAFDGVTTDGITVRVRLSRPLELPFLQSTFGDRVRVEAWARLDYRRT